MEQTKASEAVQAFAEVVRLAPEWPVGHVNLGIALLNSEAQDNYPRAESELKSVIDVEPRNCHAHYTLGMLLLYLGRFDEARRHFETVLKIDPEDTDSHYHLGFLLSGTDRREAQRHLEIVVAKVPHHESACYRLHALLRQLGETERAEQLLARFQELKQARVGVTAAMKYGEMGRYANAIRAFAGATQSRTLAEIPQYREMAASLGLSVAANGAPGWPGESGAALGPTSMSSNS